MLLCTMTAREVVRTAGYTVVLVETAGTIEPVLTMVAPVTTPPPALARVLPTTEGPLLTMGGMIITAASVRSVEVTLVAGAVLPLESILGPVLS